MVTARVRRAVTAALVVVGAVSAVPAAAAYAEGDGGADAAASGAASGPTSIAVPYLGSASIEPGEGWQITDCAGPRAASPLVVACEPAKITLSAPSFDPEAPVTIVPVPLSNGRTSIVVDYSVSLAPPEAPTVAGGEVGHPVAAGSTALLPLSDLGIACAVCAEGGALDVVEVLPAEAGSAASNGTHLVFRPSAGFTGDAELVVRYADDYGAWSADASIVVPVYAPSATLIASSITTPLGDGPQTVDLMPLVFRFGGDADITLVGCGSTIHGSVVCAPDGTAVYAPSGASVDQFSYHVVSTDGEHATGSVTFVPDAAGQAFVPASAIGADDGVPSKIVPRVPVEGDAAGVRSGIFAPLIETLDRAGVR
ncbi:hypothetical protein JOE59_000272 [Agromyces cerinus]|uniref:hypothetical protein n=1 Tax=Agromyces cerinus TaxID=33878 RepID=UPI00195BB9F5|nr:hypothetical protein [Agromyces cerinus]MBM7829567.1 hypothetical protein [Agromyces cerinus]